MTGQGNHRSLVSWIQIYISINKLFIYKIKDKFKKYKLEKYKFNEDYTFIDKFTNLYACIFRVTSGELVSC